MPTIKILENKRFNNTIFIPWNELYCTFERSLGQSQIISVTAKYIKLVLLIISPHHTVILLCLQLYLKFDSHHGGMVELALQTYNESQGQTQMNFGN